MENNNNIQNKVEAALNSLNDVQRATPTPFFYTRVRARLEREYSVWEKFSGFIARPVVALACACLIITMNAVFVLNNSDSSSSTPYVIPPFCVVYLLVNLFERGMLNFE